MYSIASTREFLHEVVEGMRLCRRAEQHMVRRRRKKLSRSRNRKGSVTCTDVVLSVFGCRCQCPCRMRFRCILSCIVSVKSSVALEVECCGARACGGYDIFPPTRKRVHSLCIIFHCDGLRAVGRGGGIQNVTSSSCCDNAIV